MLLLLFFFYKCRTKAEIVGIFISSPPTGPLKNFIRNSLIGLLENFILIPCLGMGLLGRDAGSYFPTRPGT